jgi:hypothetical protein
MKKSLGQLYKSFTTPDSSMRKNFDAFLGSVESRISSVPGDSVTGKKWPGGKRPVPGPLTDTDRMGWYEAAAHSKPPRSAEQIKAELKRRNYWRWRTMRRDFKYFQKRMKKMGLNPDDLRWLL